MFDNLPYWGQNLLLSCKSFVHSMNNKDFNNALREWESHNTWSYEQMCDYRDKKLRKMVRHCYDTVPYYKKMFDEGGINPEHIKTLEDMKVIPILTKQEIVANPSLFLSSKYDVKKLIDNSTSGSTGSSLVLKVEYNNIAKQFAIWWRYYHRLGITKRLKNAEFASFNIIPQSQQNPPYWRKNYYLNRISFSTFHGTPETYFDYYEELNKFKPIWIHGFPSCLVPFASFLVENGLRLNHQLFYVTLGAENVYDYQKAIIKQAFGCDVYSHYGLTEAVANFSERVNGVTEVDEDFAATEFIQDGDLYRVVGTNLINYTMPLLRYDTNDLVGYDGKIGEQGRIINFIDGRSGDYLVFPDGRKIGAFSALFTETSHIKEAQLYQNKDYSLDVRFVPTDDNWQDDIIMVEKKLRERIKNAIPFHFVKLDKIERTKRGKIRYVFSELNDN